MTDVLIIGAGLSGLAAAFTLREAAPALAVRLLEARERPGGRILTVQTAVPGVGLDLGPTWFWPGQEHIRALLAQLGLSTFPQYQEGAALFEADQTGPPQRFLPEHFARGLVGVRRVRR